MLQPADSYDAAYGAFRWRIPARFNIGVDVCDKWAHEGDKLALILETAQGAVETFSFARLKALSDRFAIPLTATGKIMRRVLRDRPVDGGGGE